MAFLRGTWNLSQTPKAGGEEEQSNGKWLAVQQRQPDGSWKIARTTWNLAPQDEADEPD